MWLEPRGQRPQLFDNSGDLTAVPGIRQQRFDLARSAQVGIENINYGAGRPVKLGQFFLYLGVGLGLPADHLLDVVPVSDRAEPGAQGRKGFVGDWNVRRYHCGS